MVVDYTAKGIMSTVQQRDAVESEGFGRRATTIRHLRRADLPEVARLFSHAFPANRWFSETAVGARLERVYLDHPWYEEELSSLVAVSRGGEIEGFLGCFPFPLEGEDRRYRAVSLGVLMVGPARQGRLLGPRLVRRAARGAADLVFTDTANRASLGIGRSVGFSILPVQSFEWVRILRPVTDSLDRRSGRIGRKVVRFVGGLLRPFDLAVTSLSGRPHPVSRPGVRSRAIDAEEFCGEWPRFVEDYSIAPAWRAGDLQWVLDRTGEITGRGRLHLRAVDGPRGIVGLYACHVRAQGRAIVLQLLAKRRAAARVVDCLIADALADGATSVVGTVQPHLLEGLLVNGACAYRHRATSLVLARDPDLIQAALSGRVFLGGLIGEGWMGLDSDSFRS